MWVLLVYSSGGFKKRLTKCCAMIGCISNPGHKSAGLAIQFTLVDVSLI
jgi:ribosomal protein L2